MAGGLINEINGNGHMPEKTISQLRRLSKFVGKTKLDKKKVTYKRETGMYPKEGNDNWSTFFQVLGVLTRVFTPKL